VPGLFRG